MSQCNENLQTASMPATTTITTDTAPVTASAVLGQVSNALGQCSKAGDVRTILSTATTAPSPPPTSRAAKGRESHGLADFMFAGFVQCVLGECLTLSRAPWNFMGM